MSSSIHAAASERRRQRVYVVSGDFGSPADGFTMLKTHAPTIPTLLRLEMFNAAQKDTLFSLPIEEKRRLLSRLSTLSS